MCPLPTPGGGGVAKREAVFTPLVENTRWNIREKKARKENEEKTAFFFFFF